MTTSTPTTKITGPCPHRSLWQCRHHPHDMTHEQCLAIISCVPIVTLPNSVLDANRERRLTPADVANAVQAVVYELEHVRERLESAKRRLAVRRRG
jgi:hypothetical protein